MSRSSKRWRWIGVVLAVAVPSVLVAAVPHMFTASTPIKSTEVNANFAALDQQIAALQGKVTTLESGNAPLLAGAAKAWVLFQGNGAGSAPIFGTPHNVSSVTRNGVGDYMVSFTTPFATNVYACLVTIGNGINPRAVAGVTMRTATSVRIITHQVGTGNVDQNEVAVACFGSQ